MAVRREIARDDRPFRPCQAQHQKRSREVESGNRHVHEPNAKDGEQPGASQRPGDAGAVLGRARNADGADQLPGRHDLGKQRAADAEIRRADQAHDRNDDHDAQRRQLTGQRQDHDGRRERRIGKTHCDQEIAMADAVADHAEHGRDQCSHELE
ncbi:hypothetical protein ACVIHB_004519 [Bradyrhizobium liaoningense]